MPRELPAARARAFQAFQSYPALLVDGREIRDALNEHCVVFFRDQQLRISRLARGLPMGGDLDYVDGVTLSHALQARQEIA